MSTPFFPPKPIEKKTPFFSLSCGRGIRSLLHLPLVGDMSSVVIFVNLSQTPVCFLVDVKPKRIIDLYIIYTRCYMGDLEMASVKKGSL